MTSLPNTGPTVPGWIREQIARYEAEWPLRTLMAGMVLTIAVDICLGMLIWTSKAVLYYARP